MYDPILQIVICYVVAGILFLKLWLGTFSNDLFKYFAIAESIISVILGTFILFDEIRGSLKKKKDEVI